MDPKLKKKLCYEPFQYGAGDILITNEREKLHLFEAVDSVSCSAGITREGFSLKKKFYKCSRKINLKRASNVNKI